MTLQFVVRVNRKAPPRIGVLRIITDNEKGKIKKYENIGTLPGLESEKLNGFIKENKLTLAEQYQLENYVANLNFSQSRFHATPEELKRNLNYSSPKYDDALLKLWELAKEHNIAFCPAEIQQNALLNKAKAVERKINELTKKSINVLTELGLDITRLEENEAKDRMDETTLQLFNLILKIDKNSLSDLCEEFMKIARVNYGKNLKFKPHYFKEYATTLKRYPLWYNSVAVDLLMNHQINPINSISADKIANYWINVRKDKLSLKEAFAEFKKTFNPKPADEEKVMEALIEAYKKGISTANA